MTWRIEWWKSLPQNIEKIIKKKKNEDSLTDLWDNIKCTNIPIIGGPRRRRKGLEKIFKEIITENFPNMGKEVVNLVQDAKRVPSSINPRRNTQDT